MPEVFKFRKGYGFPVEAQIVGDELERIRIAHGGTLTPETVVNEATNQENPIHICFTWDDTLAARKQRLQEARILIGAVEVTYHQAEKRQYHNVTVEYEAPEPTSEKVYVDIHSALDDEFQPENTLKAKQHLEQFIKKFDIFPYLTDKVNAVQNILNNW